MAKKKKVSKVFIRERNKIYYANKQKKKIDEEINKYKNFKETTKVLFNGKKRMVKTVRNELTNKKIAINTKYKKTIDLLEKKYGYKYGGLKKAKKNKIGLIISPPFSFYNGKDAKNWAKNEIPREFLPDLFAEIDYEIQFLTSGKSFKIVYNAGLYNDLINSEQNVNYDDVIELTGKEE